MKTTSISRRSKTAFSSYLAVRKLKKDPRGPILCFVGPPGVGKTSLGRSIRTGDGAQVRPLLLGGCGTRPRSGDTAEPTSARFRPHHSGTADRGSNNPLFMLDEIDKLGADFRGDPASALLEVLDPSRTTPSPITTSTSRSISRG